MRHLATTVLVAAWLAAAGAPAAETDPTPEPPPRTAAFLFEYEISPGLEAQFADGYRRHLDWHRAAGDPLSWYAWFVLTGPRAGRFVDGTFNLSFQDFDDRVDPGGDRTDGRRNVLPFARPVSRLVYRLRPELGTSILFADSEPTAMIEAVRVEVRAGREAAFEKAFRSAISRGLAEPAFSCYQLVSGGARPSYLLLIARESWSEYERASRSPLGIDGVDSGVSADDPAVDRLTVETWGFRQDLTYVPPPR